MKIPDNNISVTSELPGMLSLPGAAGNGTVRSPGSWRTGFRLLAAVAGRFDASLKSVYERFHRADWPLLFGKLVLIYQMPKTGSQTVEGTLQSCRLPHRVLRFHYLSPEMAEEIRRGPASNRAVDDWEAMVRPQIAFMVRMSRVLSWRRWLTRCGVPIPKVQIIAAVREPIGLALSSVFENHQYFFENLDQATLDDFISVLSRPRLYRFQDWFDLELNALTKLRVYDRPFSHEKGYAIYENSFARVLIYRFDFLPKLRVMLRDLLGCEVPDVVIRNRGEAKNYAQLYAWAKANVRLSADFVGTQLNSRMIRHFYSPEERAEIRERWSQNECKVSSVLGMKEFAEAFAEAMATGSTRSVLTPSLLLP
jgi:hypothetical protein